MKPVFQSKLYLSDGPHSGNCLAACLASLFEMPLWMVPEFDQMFVRGDYGERMQEWARRIHGVKLMRSGEHEPEKMPKFYIANGLSSRSVYHSVIYSNGTLAHDPHPSGAGIIDVEWTWHAEAVLPESEDAR